MSEESILIKQKKDSFANSPWYFSHESNWDSLFSGAPIIEKAKDETIFVQGEKPEYVYFIKKGRIRSSIFDESGQEKTILVFTEGSIVGENAALADSCHEVTATANITCTLACLPYKSFIAEVNKSAYHANQLSLSLTNKVSRLTNQIKEIAFLKSDSRVITYLIKLADHFGEHQDNRIKISIPFTQQEMADLVATSRVSVAKVMSMLTKEGILERKGGYIYITDVIALTEKQKEYDNCVVQNRSR